MKEYNEGGSQDVKNHSEINIIEPIHIDADKTCSISVTNKEVLVKSLYQSYLTKKIDDSKKCSNIFGKLINRIAQFM